MEYPKIIQGGMGIGVSNWTLAHTVSKLGQLGVVSGTALDAVLARRLQLGDMGGHIQRAFENFPFPDMARRIFDQYFVHGGKPEDQPFKPTPMHTHQSSQNVTELTVLANFTEVFLAREGHDGLVGINFLEKIQTPTLPSLYGAMLAGVAFVLMGAGIPRTIPGILDDLAQGKPVRLRLDVEEAVAGEEFAATFDPQAFCGGNAPALARPKFLAIVSSATLAMSLARKSTGRVDGFIVEGATAGGHNAPPRGQMQLTEKGEPLYGVRDTADLVKIKELGLPFWLAGSYGLPGKLREALALGAVGVQVGTAFAFCEESGLDPALRKYVLDKSRAGDLAVFTDPTASPTGFPFKVVQIDESLSDLETYKERERVCDLGYLRHAYRKEDGTLGYRCSAEPVKHFVRKGGKAEDTIGRRCLCNSLLADISLGQVLSEGEAEKALLTAGDEVANVSAFLKPGAESYTAAEVIEQLLAGV
jgi:nitronate monooxygenase